MQVVWVDGRRCTLNANTNPNTEKWRKTCVKNVLCVCPYKIHMLPHWTWTMATFSTLCFSRRSERTSGRVEWSGLDENKRILVTLLSLLIEFYLLLVFIIIIIAVVVAAATVRIVVVVVVFVVAVLLHFIRMLYGKSRGHRRQGKTWRLSWQWMPISCQRITTNTHYSDTKYEVVFLVRAHTVQTTLSDHFGRRETERPFIQSN